MPKRITQYRIGPTLLRERPLLLWASTWDDGSTSYQVQDQETGFTLHPGSLDTMPGIEDIEAMIHTLGHPGRSRILRSMPIRSLRSSPASITG